jgi:hypothetical protein
MSKKQATPVPNLLSEMFMSLLKVFCLIILVIIIVNNAVWVYYVSKPSRVGDTHVEITQNKDSSIKNTTN